MLRIAREHYTYSFDKDVPAIAEIESGDRLTLETHDSSTGRIKRREDLDYYLSVRKTHESNPACGPVTVKGAMPGDGLNVRIEQHCTSGLPAFCALRRGPAFWPMRQSHRRS